MAIHELLKKIPELEELVRAFRYEVQQANRPASEVVMDDVDLQKFLKISKRKTAELRANGLIKYSKPDGKVFYILSDVLEYVSKNTVEPIDINIKFNR